MMCILSLVGCFFRSDDEDIQVYIDRMKNSEPESVTPIPDFQQYQGADYTVESLRSPFQISEGMQRHLAVQEDKGAEDPEIDVGLQQKIRPDINRERELLEEFSLLSLKLVGTLQKNNKTWGLILDQTGYIHRVQVGDYIGENSGQIQTITADEVYIKELVVDGKGGWKYRKAKLSIQE